MMSILEVKGCSVEEAQSLFLDEACLDVFNQDASNVLEIWGQSTDCYKCLAWKYAALKPNQSVSMVVNTTFETELFIRSLFQSQDIDSATYQFVQHGWYQLNVTSSGFSPIKIEHEGNSEILDLLFVGIGLVICQLLFYGGYFAYRKMREYRLREAGDEDEGLVPDTQSLEDEEVEENEIVDTRPHRSRRLHSLDAFRGLSVILMIFVNYGGGGYYFFKHARWNGLTFADLVFPWFLWIMGTCLVFSIHSQVRQSICHKQIFAKIVKRSFILFAIGLLLNGKAVYLPQYRYMGVLQRLGLCYFITATLELVSLKMERQTQISPYGKLRDLTSAWFPWLITTLLVLINIIITFFLAVPGCPKGYLGPGGLHMNGSHPGCTGGATGYVDRLLLGKSHLYRHPTCRKVYNDSMPFDPEGLLSTLMASLTVQLGAAAGRIILSYAGHKQRLKRWLCWAVFLGTLSGFLCAWSREEGYIPLNKNLWSLSYTLATGSFAFILFSFLYIVVDMLKWYGGTPFVQAGRNPMVLYIGHEILKPFFPWSWTPIANTHVAHLGMNLLGVFLWLLIALYLDSKNLFFII